MSTTRDETSAQPQPEPSKNLECILVAALVIIAIGARLIPGPRIIDDAYITFRYARNIVRGDGFVYNPGEHVLGTTTPLYTLLLAGIGAAGGSTDFPAVAPIINALADGVGVALLYIVARRLIGGRLPALIVAALWAVSPRSVTFAISGMETSVYVMLMLGAFAAWVTSPPPGSDGAGRHGTAIAILTGLAILTRPDALIWAGPLALAMIWERLTPHSDNNSVGARHALPLSSPKILTAMRRLPWRELAITLAVIAPWAIYGTLTFGSPLTRSFIAKLAAYPVPAGKALATFAVHYGIPFYEQSTFGGMAALIGVPVYTALAVVGAVAMVRLECRSAPLAVFPWLYALTFSIANPPMFHWYLVPPMPIYNLCIVAGVWALLRRITLTVPLGATRAHGGAKHALPLRSALMLAAGAAWLVFSLDAWTLHPSVPPDRPAPLTAWNLPEVTQSAVGERLAPLARPDKVIAGADIGALGWASDARILDVVGLISPQATPYYPVDPAMINPDAGFAVSPQLIFDLKPDYIMLHEAYGQNGLFKDPRFAQQYRLLAVYPIDVGHSRRLLVYERNTGAQTHSTDGAGKDN